jgi:carbon starvation protein
MNSLVALVLALLVAFLGYRIYAQYVDRNIFKSDPKKTTPARMFMDGVDFIPASKNVLIGFQFKSIAATGPVVGAITAAQWGWLPALLWLFGGVLFIGWLQDYSSVMLGVRKEGQTFTALSYRMISPRARLILLLFLYFYLLLIAGAFGNLVASSLTDTRIPFGIIALTVLGVLAGQMIYRWRVDILVTTLITTIVAVIAIWLGSLPFIADIFKALPNDPKVLIAGTMLTGSKFFWAVAILVFCYLGAVLPIWRFAQPINFVSFWIVAIAMIVGALGIVVGHPDFTTPALVTWDIAKAGSGAFQPIWPMLFVTIACGAISGWHSLVSSSGTARQLENEKDALPVAGGSMFAEMVLALIALVAAVATYSNFQGYLDAFSKVGAGGVFSGGMSALMGYVGVPLDAGVAFAGAVFCILALTVMQLVIRFMRVATAELAGDRAPILKNFHVATVIALLLTLFLVATGTFNYLWQLFGGSNQLMAGLALMLVTIYLMSEGRSTAFVFWPMVFMLVTTTAALLVTSYNLLVANVLLPMSAGKAVDPGIAAGNTLMGIIGLFLVVAAVILVYDGWKAMQALRGKGPAAAAAHA